MKECWKNYNLSIVLAILFIVSWAVQTWAGWVSFAEEQHSHHQIATVLGDSGYVWEWLAATFENWQSEFLQLLTFVVLTSFLIHKGSHESKDGDELIMRKLNNIERKLDALEQSRVSR